MEDLEQFGEFKKINNSPLGMFPDNAKSFYDKKEISQKEFIRIFITQKGLMEKNTHNVILGLGYFEFFNMQQLKESKTDNQILNTLNNVSIENPSIYLINQITVVLT